MLLSLWVVLEDTYGSLQSTLSQASAFTMADHNMDESVQQAPEPTLCNNCRQFYGNAASMGMCSKCYREEDMQKAKDQAVAQEIAAVAASVLPQAVKPLPTFVAPPPPAPTLIAPTEEATPTLADEADERPVQKNKSRCFSCKKKIGLTGFKCRCSYFFCSEHRYSDKHECSYDYKAANRDALTKANPTVIADKVQRI